MHVCVFLFFTFKFQGILMRIISVALTTPNHTTNQSINQSTNQVLGKLLMEHSVAPYHLSLPILKHLLGLPVAFSDLEFADVELHRNLQWLR